MPKSAHYISFCQNSSFVICTEIKNNNTLRWGIETFKFTLVYWQLDTFGRSLNSLAMAILYTTIKCVTLWFLYVGRHGEKSESWLLRLWTKAAMTLDWGSSNLDITTAVIVGISHCLYCFGYCTVLMLTVLTDGKWKLAATYCNVIRCHHCGMMLQTDPGCSTPWRNPAKSTADITVKVDSKCLNYITLHWKL